MYLLLLVPLISKFDFVNCQTKPNAILTFYAPL